MTKAVTAPLRLIWNAMLCNGYLVFLLHDLLQDYCKDINSISTMQMHITSLGNAEVKSQTLTELARLFPR